MKLLGVTGAAALSQLESGHFRFNDAKEALKRNFQESDVKTQTTQALKAYDDAQLKAKDDMEKLPVEQAYSKIQAKIPEEGKGAIALLMKDDNSTESDPASMMAKAMGALNEMFLTTDEERVVEAQTCRETIEAIHRQMWTHIDQWHMLSMDASDFRDKQNTAESEYEGKLEEIQDQVDFIAEMRSRQELAMKREMDILHEMEGQVNLYAFIVGEVDEGCEEGGDKAEESFLLQKKKHEKMCVKGATVSDAMTTLFASPRVQAKIAAMSEKNRALLDDHVNALSSDEKMEEEEKEQGLGNDDVPPMSFVQTSAKNVCGPMTTSCDDLLSIVGQELHCKKKDVLVQNEVIAKLQDEQEQELARANRGLVLLKKTLDAIGDRVAHFSNGVHETMMQMEEQEQLYEELYHDTKITYARCAMTIVELETNYCGVKKLRQFMLDRAIKKGMAKAEEIEDCEFDEYMVPDPECMMDGRSVDCMPGDKVPTNPSELPKRIWRREIRAEPNNNTFSLPCPPRRDMKRTCNAFLCPVHCEVSEFEPWSTCTADCDGGTMTHMRKVMTPPRYGGAKCPMTTGREECNSHPCNVDCMLHHYWWSKTGCLQSCGDDRVRLVHKAIWEPAIGQGHCPDKESAERLKTKKCRRRRCINDEVCSDMMDLAIVYECSASTTKLGCYFIAEFVKHLMSRMASHVFELQSMKVSLIKFGNGKAVKDKVSGEYSVSPAKLVSPLSGNIEKLQTLVMEETYQLWDEEPAWHLGFNNAAEGLMLAADILGSSSRGGRPYYASKKALVLTKGKRAECTTLGRTSDAMQEDGIDVATILFASDYKDTEDSKKKYELVKEMVSYPDDVNFNLIEGVALLADSVKRDSFVDKIIPRICPRAMSPRRYRWRARWSGVAMVHYGRTCTTWTSPESPDSVVLGVSVRNPRSCGRLAEEAGYKSFIFSWQSWWERKSGNVPNCFTHKSEGTVAQVDADGKPVDTTCGCKTFQCTGQVKDAKGGWLGQMITGYRRWRPTSHYRVYHKMSETEPPIKGIFRFDGGEGTSETKAE